MQAKLLKAIAPQVVYGGVDGTVSTFAVVAGAYGGGLEQSAIFILGVASLVADGFSMAVGAYLSAEAGQKKTPLRNGVVTFLSFNILGSLLLLPYLYGVIAEVDDTVAFVVSALLAIFSFSIVGVMKSRAEGFNVVRGTIEVILLGGVAAAIAYFIGDVLESLVS